MVNIAQVLAGVALSKAIGNSELCGSAFMMVGGRRVLNCIFSSFCLFIFSGAMELIHGPLSYLNGLFIWCVHPYLLP